MMNNANKINQQNMSNDSDINYYEDSQYNIQ